MLQFIYATNKKATMVVYRIIKLVQKMNNKNNKTNAVPE